MEYFGKVKPGQFFQVSIPKYGEAPISVSGIGPDYVDLTIRRVGRVTGEVFERYEGDSLFMRGPYGNGFDVDDYVFFQGMPSKTLRDHDIIDLGGREIEVLHTPGHSPGHMCFWEKKKGYLFTGDLVYKDTLFAYYPSTDPEAYLASLEKISALPVKRVFPAHHSLDIQPEILIRMMEAFRQLKRNGKLHHGSGTYDYGDWGVWL